MAVYFFYIVIGETDDKKVWSIYVDKVAALNHAFFWEQLIDAGVPVPDGEHSFNLKNVYIKEVKSNTEDEAVRLVKKELGTVIYGREFV